METTIFGCRVTAQNWLCAFLKRASQPQGSHFIRKGPRTQKEGFQGPSTVPVLVFGPLKPYYLGPWTRRVCKESLR